MGFPIPYDEGEYSVEDAFLHVSAGHGLRVSEVVVEIYADGSGKNLRGCGRVLNALFVELLEGGEDADLILVLAPGHCYRLTAPVLRAGKVFTPGLRSTFHFQPRTPWEALDERELENLVAGTLFLDPA